MVAIFLRRMASFTKRCLKTPPKFVKYENTLQIPGVRTGAYAHFWKNAVVHHPYIVFPILIYATAATIGTVRYYVWIKNTHTDELHKYKNDYTVIRDTDMDTNKPWFN